MLGQEEKRRNRRSRGIDELFGLVDDIHYLDRCVSKMGFLERSKYRKLYMAGMDRLDDHYLCLVMECIHQVHNDAYEDLLVFHRKQGLAKLVAYLTH
jgi:hypothetical protein